MTVVTGFPLTLGVAWRTSWRQLAGWVAGLTAGLAGTVFALHSTYGTPEKIAEYARAVRSGDALVAVNGRVAGIDSLGGVVANEFGFVAAFTLPLMGISIVARLTRREEESGRLDLLLAGRVGRAAGVASALAVAVAAVGLTTGAFALCLALVGIPIDRALLYACSLGGLALCFAAVAALAAQGVRRARGVYAAGLGLLAAAYLVRGVGDVTRSWLTWLSPLGWAEQTRAFGDDRWWPLVVPLVVSATGFAVALLVSARRDVGSSWAGPSRGATSVGPALRRPGWLALRAGRWLVAGWALGATTVAGVFGALARQAAEALDGSAQAREALGGAGASGADVMLRLDLVLLCLMGAAFAISWVGALREEETTERLEVTLAGTVSRTGWLGQQLVALLVGVLVVQGAGSLALALTSAWSLDDASQVARLLEACAAQVPAVLVLAAAALALFGARPRWLAGAWLWFAGTATVALLAGPLGLPQWLRDLAPTEHVGDLPSGSLDRVGVSGLGVVAAAFLVVAFVGFRRRDVPQR